MVNCKISSHALQCLLAYVNPATTENANEYVFMSMKRHLYHLGHNASPRLGHIWVGDDVLDAAIQRFGRLAVAKRTVSLAPGPLEARKRETKRRLAYVSQANGGILASFDASLVAGINEKAREGQWRWQAPGTPGLSTSSSLTPWLGELFNHPTAPIAATNPQKHPALNTGLREGHQDIGHRIQEYAFLSRLDRCKNLDELRDLASFFEIDVRKHSSIAFRQVYSAQGSLRSCLTFLEDPSLDDPYAQNLKFLLAEVLQQLKDQADADPARLVSVLNSILVSWVESQLSLGKRPWVDVEGLLQFIDDLAQLKPFESFRLDIVRAILRGLRSSTILGFRDLEPEHRSSLLKSIMRGDLTLDIEDLGFSLIETMNDVVLISRFLAKSLRWRPASHEKERAQLVSFPRISNFLQSRSQAQKNLITRYTTRDLVEWTSTLPRDSLFDADLMDQWWSTVVEVTAPDFPGDGIRSMELEWSMPLDRPDTLASYVVHLGDRNKVRFVLLNWFANRLSSSDCEKLFSKLKQNLFEIRRETSFFCMLKTVHDCGFLQHDFISHVFRILIRMRMFKVMTTMIGTARKYRIYIPHGAVIDAIRQVLPMSPTEAFQIFRCDRRIPLECVPDLATAFIEHSEIHASVIWKYQEERPWQSILNVDGISADYLPMSRAQFLEKVAVAFSTTSKLSARMARKEVTECIKWHRLERLGPLSAQISRALVRVGIIRPLREKRQLSHLQLTYVLAMVREIEGPKRADEIDRILDTWRQQLWKQEHPKRDMPPSFLPKRMAIAPNALMRWCKRHAKYERVTDPTSRAIPDECQKIGRYSLAMVGKMTRGPTRM